MIDSTIVRAHQHSAGAKGSNAEQEDLGRSVDGLSTNPRFHEDMNSYRSRRHG